MKKLTGPDPDHLADFDGFDKQVLADYREVERMYMSTYLRTQRDYISLRRDLLLVGTRLPVWKDQNMDALLDDLKIPLRLAQEAFEEACKWLQAEIDRVQPLYDQELALTEERVARANREFAEAAATAGNWMCVCAVVLAVIFGLWGLFG